MDVPQAAIDLVTRFEGLSLNVYRDLRNIPTIGYGHVILPEDNLTDGMEITKEQVDAFLMHDLRIAMHRVISLTNIHLNDNQLSALISFVFNLGAGCYQRSTLRMLVNRKQFFLCGEQFMRYIHAGPIIVKGLVLRRKAESDLFISMT